MTAWTSGVTDIVFVYNPRASNVARSERWMKLIAARLKLKPQRLDIVTQQAELGAIIASLKDKQVVLLAIAGGDGTVSSLVNTLIRLRQPGAPGQLVLLPLWGGNANDMSYMLNGLSSAMTAKRLVETARPVAVPLIKLTFTGEEARTVYACCYASFGASAYAARQLDNRGFAKRKIIQYLPPVIMVRELITVAKAVTHAPVFRARFGSIEAKAYEHTLINGSRIAKVNRVPVELTDRVFFHAVVTKRDPSLILELARVIARKRSPIYSTKSELSFTIHDAIDAQVDGEVYRLAGGTAVEASVDVPAFDWLSVK